MVGLGIKSLSVYEKNYASVMVFILKPESCMRGKVLTQCWILVIKHQRSEAKAYRTVLVTWSTSKLFYRVASKTSYDRLGSNLSFSDRRHSPQLFFCQAIVKTWNGATYLSSILKIFPILIQLILVNWLGFWLVLYSMLWWLLFYMLLSVNFVAD